MSFIQKTENFFLIKPIVSFLNWIKIPGLRGMSLYELMKVYAKGIAKSLLTMRAAAISWSLFLSVFPFLLFVFWVLPFLPNFNEIEETFYQFLIGRIFPSSQVENITDSMSKISKYEAKGNWLSLGLALIFAANGVNALMNGFKQSTKEIVGVDSRKMLSQYGFAAFFTVLYTLLLLGFLWLINYVVGPGSRFIEEAFSQEWFKILIIYGTLYGAAFLLFFTAVIFLYRFGVRFEGRVKSVLPGALLTTILFFIMSLVFSYYIDHFTSYSLLYGSLSVILIVMLFLYLTVVIILLGFELNISILLAKNIFNEEEILE